MYLILAGDHFLGLRPLPESILEPAGQSLHVSHATGPDGSPALGLHAPVEVPHLRGGISAAGACFLLNVVRNFPATATGRVGLVVPFTERGGSLSLFCVCRGGGEGQRQKEGFSTYESEEMTAVRSLFRNDANAT